MPEITAALVKALRDKTGLGMMTCKEALTASDGDGDKAVEWLRKKGLDAAGKRMGRATKEGAIGSYIHMNGRIGVLVELNCESDFVARSEDFQLLLKDLCMQVAATAPIAVSPADVDEKIVARERDIYAGQVTGKPKDMVDKIVEGKLKKFFAEQCLIEQPFVKNPDMSVNDRVKGAIAKLGENITVRRFIRFQLGED
jgi:elongation factor Ts